jgi:hypothetical protein
MGDVPRGCDSGYDHKHNDVVHYFGCLKEAELRPFFQKLPSKDQERIRAEERRTTRLRALFEAEGQRTEKGKLLIRFKQSLAHWRSKKPPQQLPPFKSSSAPLSNDPEDDPDLKATMVYYKDALPYDHPQFPDKFPNQKIALNTLLYDKTEANNPLVRDCEPGMIRYFHLPANNMHWVEVGVDLKYLKDRPLIISYRKPLLGTTGKIHQI